MLTLLRKTLPALLALCLLAACSAFAEEPRPLPPLRVEYTQWWGDYTLLIAQEKGYFAKYGVEVEPVYYPIFSDSFTDLAAGQIDAALIASGDVINIHRHAPIKIVGISDDGGYMPIVARPEIKTIQDLRGQRVGTLAGTQYELLVMEMLLSAEMDLGDVSIQNIPPENAVAALEKNEIQAAFMWEPFTTQALAAGAQVLYPTDEDLRLFPDTIAFRESVVRQRPHDIQAFMYAWFEAVEFRMNNPEETRRIAAQALGVPVEQIQPDPSLKLYTYEDNLVLFTEFTPEGNSIFDIMRKTADYLIASGAIARKPDFNAILTQDFLALP